MNEWTNRGLYMKYFVLSPTKMDAYGKASREALNAYAEAIEEHDDVLAAELRAWRRRLEEACGRKEE